MAKYDEVFNSEEVSEETLSAAEAVAAMAVVTAFADANDAEIDVETLASMLWGFETFEEYSEDEMASMLDKLINIAEDESVGTLFNSANESLSDDSLFDAYAAGVMMLVDEEKGIVPKSKMSFLNQLQAALELDNEEAQEILDEVITAFKEALLNPDDESEPEMYQSPEGNFQLPIPVDVQDGGNVESEPGLVGFSDEFGTLLQINYQVLPEDQVAQLQSLGEEGYLKSALLDIYVPDAIAKSAPNSRVEHDEYIRETISGYFVVINMPQGSTMAVEENNSIGKRLDAYRGILAFVNQGFLYFVSCQRNFLDGEVPGSIDEEAQALKGEILEFVSTIEFG
ncbi:MAG: hypothetical protein H0X31_17090 [Nostocaceae cyanobacterium]|nr:hypothetical protein [Nostocaceae cyanobacterium]